MYNDPAGGVDSSIGKQFNTSYWHKKSLIEARKESYFMQLASTINMPKHYGKEIKMYEYIPLLDDENVNDQGIDATGATIADGNLYGSSKDIGAIPGKLPTLSEEGGRVNRVGFTRKELRGTFQNFGFFTDYTEDSVQFDTDAELMMHINRETINGAHEITEDTLQIDLLNAAGVVRYPGAATSTATINKDHVVTYSDLMHLNIELDNNRTPKHTKIITGTRLIDTKVIDGCRTMYIGSELIPTLKAMKDLHGERAFKPIESYAAGTVVMNGEIGSIDGFRFILVPEMLKWAGAGVASTAGSSSNVVYETGGKVDVFPMLSVGDDSFTTIGFQTDGKTVKFKQIHKKPGENMADLQNPYGKKGFMSIQWWYGFLAKRPERIGLIKTAATM